MFDYVLCLHVHLLKLTGLEKVAEIGLLLGDIKFVFFGVLAGRNKHNSLVHSRQGLYSFLAFHDPFPQLLYPLPLLRTFLHMSLRDGGAGLREGVEVHEDLVSSLPRMEVINGEVEVVGSD